MNYWPTIHWPPFEDELDRIPELELQYEPRELGFAENLRKGDWVFIYRTKTGPTFNTEVNEKMIEIFRIREKHSGVISLYTAKSGQWMRRLGDFKGGRRWEEWFVELEKTHHRGLIPRTEVNRILGFKPGNTFRSYGPKGCGLNLISESQGKQFIELLK